MAALSPSYRDRLFHRIISGIKFERRLSIGLKNEQIYALAERFCDLVCSDGIMVVGADIPGFSHGVPGKFGKDEPWPDWVDRKALEMEGLGSGLIDHSQKMTVAARAIAEKKTVGHRS